MSTDSEKFRPKHTISDSNAFQKGREQLGKIILQGMKTTGGTDVDWLIEHRGGFIILELKEFHDNVITIPVGQMIAFEKLHERLISGGKCFFLIFANDSIDFKNPDSSVWYFDMIDWNNGNIPKNKTKTGRWYVIEREFMHKITIQGFRDIIESFWKEFEK